MLKQVEWLREGERTWLTSVNWFDFFDLGSVRRAEKDCVK